MANEHEDFLSADTEKKIAEFEAKLRAEQAAMPDTSIRAGAGGINVLENYHFGDEQIPIYNSGLNKQIDRVDMKVDRARRTRRTQVADEVDQYMREIRAELQAKEMTTEGKAVVEEEHKTAPFIYIFPGILAAFGVIVVVVMSLA